MFLPSGRVHTIGAGNVILEIQQNSDTTFRVFDFRRPGLDGRPRELAALVQEAVGGAKRSPGVRASSRASMRSMARSRWST